MVTYEKGNMFITFQGSGSAEMSFPKVFALDAMNFLKDLLEQPFDGRYMSGGSGGTKRIQTTSAYGYSQYKGKIKEFYGNWWYTNDLREIIRILGSNVITLRNLVEKYKTRKELIEVLKDKSIRELNYLLEEAKR